MEGSNYLWWKILIICGGRFQLSVVEGSNYMWWKILIICGGIFELSVVEDSINYEYICTS